MNLSGKRTRTRRNSGESCSITITATKGESRLIGNSEACEPVWCNFQVQGQRIPKRGSSVFFYVYSLFYAIDCRNTKSRRTTTSKNVTNNKGAKKNGE
ncbi:hypothetical protein CD31_05235 [Lysinibacillus boronitolerans JCM 21713 = 10a = NBRC 103108]|uniref:Uncharacterized protein n=1 Tax=Lysinibacillus boronitolerans JCM 21713 = 10a = NBRC 103108 TaxID=1294264 RepID=A0ABR4Y2H0_9BACI|nr:hypothetical protein CD31_05235 [Lysinibacillus boronitolerans JCM 21713 = 10a = NBRC 103108]